MLRSQFPVMFSRRLAYTGDNKTIIRFPSFNRLRFAFPTKTCLQKNKTSGTSIPAVFLMGKGVYNEQIRAWLGGRESMITHFRELQLNTVSIPSIRQFYHERLLLPIVQESGSRIELQVTEHCTITFLEAFEPVAPAHVAFEVPYSEFDALAALLKQQGVMIEKWPDGREVDDFGTGRNIYFRDGDGNLLELIAHHYIKEDVIVPFGSLRVLYMREIGFPVNDVAAFRTRLQELMNVKLDKVFDDFTFAIGGTAHFVLASKQRRWIPIAMVALPPRMRVTLGVPDAETLREIGSRLSENERISAADNELRLSIHGYQLCLKVDPGFGKVLPSMLKLPHSAGD